MDKSKNKAGGPSRKSGRSPSYPAIDLEKALSRTREIWDREKQFQTPLNNVLKIWKYKELNGPGSLTLAALKRFNLVTVEGSGANQIVRVSDSAVEIFKHPNIEMRIAATKKAALAPVIHQELWQKYGVGLPSEDTLKWELIKERGFTERGAEEFVPQYLRTVEFADLGDNDSEISQDPEIDSEFSPRSKRVNLGSSESPTLKTPNPGADFRTIDIPLRAGASIFVSGKFPLAGSDWDQFLAVLEVMKPGLVNFEE